MLLAVVALAILAVAAIVFAVLRSVPPSDAVPLAVPTTSPTRSAAPTPTASATPTPSATTPVGANSGGQSQGGAAPGSSQAAGPAITSFSVSPAGVACSPGGVTFPPIDSEPLTISWSSTGAAKVFLGVDTADAQAAPFATGLPASGSYGGIDYLCPDTHRYTLTIVGADGTKVSRTATVTNVGDR